MGKVTFLTEMRDAVGLAMLAIGKDPSKATAADVDEALAAMQEGRPMTESSEPSSATSYAEDLVSGNVVLAMAWSGEMSSPSRRKRRRSSGSSPTRAAMLWTDNMMIPKGAAA